MKVKLDINWNYRELVYNLRAIKEQYWDKVRSFSYYDLHEKVVFMKKFRDYIYSLNFEEWKKDKVWEYINGYEFLYVLKRLK